MRQGVTCLLLSWLLGCTAQQSALPSPLTSSISPLLTSPLAAPTVTIDEKAVPILLTAQAYPTLEPTPAIPDDARLCSATNLAPGEGSMGGATMHDFVYLPVTNTSRIGCVLQAPVNVQLVDTQEKTLPVDYSSPRETGISPSGERLKLYLRPGEAAMFMLDWGNWCMPLGYSTLTATVNLTSNDASLDIPLSFPFFHGHCIFTNTHSTLFTMFVNRIPK